MTAAADRKEQARLAVTVVAKILAEAGVDVSGIMDMDAEELTEFLADHGVDLDVAALTDSVVAQLEPDRRAIEGGLTDAAKREQVQAKVTKLLGETARNVARQTVRQAQLSAFKAAETREWDRQFYVWVSVGDAKICDSCHTLHGQVFAMDQWEDIGLPGAGQTLCGERCRCTLVPTKGTDREVTKYRDEVARGNLPKPRG